VRIAAVAVAVAEDRDAHGVVIQVQDFGSLMPADMLYCLGCTPAPSLPVTDTSTSMPFFRNVLSSDVQGLLRRFWRVAQGTPSHIAIPLGLVLLATAIEGASYALLIPLSDSVSENGFTFLAGSRAFGWIAGIVPDAALASPKRDAYLSLAVIALVVFGRSVKVLVDHARNRYLHQRDEAYRARIREYAFSRVLGFGRLYFDRTPIGTVNTELGWAESPTAILGNVEEVLRRALAIVAKAAIMVILSPLLFVVAIVAYPTIQFSLGWVHRAVGKLSHQNADLEREMQGNVLDLLSTVPLVKAFHQERAASESYAKILAAVRDLNVRRRNLMALRWPAEEILILGTILLAQAVIVFSADVFQAGDVARLAAFLLLVQQTLPELKQYGVFRLAVADQLPRLEALVELSSDDNKHIVHSGSRDVREIVQGIDVRGLTFSYGDGTTVLHDISASFPAGKMTAIVGESGTGKTTLVDVISRFYDCPEGTVFLDGSDIRDFSLESLYGKLAVVSQDVWLLNRSMRDNVVFGLEEPPSDEVVLELLAELCLDDFLREHASPLSVEIGDRGVQLSGGQRQRLALARAILRSPEILVLDEATSALDSVVEAQVERIVERRSRGRTLIVIAHRLSTIRAADQILVMKGGRVVESGGWDELLALDGAFARLHEAQFKDRPRLHPEPSGLQ
jgi:ATP-binding cassette, subfamily B, bacterial MsbA